jgi:hypothetical protein
VLPIGGDNEMQASGLGVAVPTGCGASNVKLRSYAHVFLDCTAKRQLHEHLQHIWTGGNIEKQGLAPAIAENNSIYNILCAQFQTVSAATYRVELTPSKKNAHLSLPHREPYEAEIARPKAVSPLPPEPAPDRAAER